MNMTDYSTIVLDWTQIEAKEQHFHCCSTFFHRCCSKVVCYTKITIDIYSIRNRNKCVFQYLEKSILYFTSPFLLIIKNYVMNIRVRVMVFNATFNNISVISWWSVLLVEETGVPGENH
jgi:hypothetical protein